MTLALPAVAEPEAETVTVNIDVVLPDTLDLDVIWHDINTGTPHDSHDCAVAKAVQRRFDGANASVGGYIHVTLPNGESASYEADGLYDFITRFDRGEFVQPQRFRLTRRSKDAPEYPVAGFSFDPAYYGGKVEIQASYALAINAFNDLSKAMNQLLKTLQEQFPQSHVSITAENGLGLGSIASLYIQTKAPAGVSHEDAERLVTRRVQNIINKVMLDDLGDAPIHSAVLADWAKHSLNV